MRIYNAYIYAYIHTCISTLIYLTLVTIVKS